MSYFETQLVMLGGRSMRFCRVSVIYAGQLTYKLF